MSLSLHPQWALEAHSRNISITGETSGAHLRGIAEAGMNIESKEVCTVQQCQTYSRALQDVQQAARHMTAVVSNV